MWGRFLACLAFVVGGLFLLDSNFDVAIVTIAFFGSCAVIGAIPIVRKLWPVRPAPDRVEIIGGVPIRPSKGILLTIGLWLVALAVITLVFGWSYGVIFRALMLGFLGLGCCILIGLYLGWLPAHYLQFDPRGITFGERGFSYRVQWDNISGSGAGEINSHAALLLQLYRPDAIEVEPPGRKTRALKGIVRNEQFYGAHVIIMTTQYRMDLSLLAQAIDRYIREPAARNELSQKFLVPPAPGRNSQ
jgi:hypothetical protein